MYGWVYKPIELLFPEGEEETPGVLELREKDLLVPSEKVAIKKPRRETSPETSSAGILILNLAPRTMRKKNLLFKTSTLWYFVMVAQADL